jgi:hypothetical protein
VITIDEVGCISFDQDAANLVFQRVASCCEQDLVMVTSNLPSGRRGETVSDDVVAAAMNDRLVHHAEVLILTGDSYRTRRDLLMKENYCADQQQAGSAEPLIDDVSEIRTVEGGDVDEVARTTTICGDGYRQRGIARPSTSVCPTSGSRAPTSRRTRLERTSVLRRGIGTFCSRQPPPLGDRLLTRKIIPLGVLKR